MSIRSVLSGLVLTLLFIPGLFAVKTAEAAEGVTLYTPFTKISVPPGESVEYTIDIKNSSSEVKNAGILVSGLPKGWNYTLKSGGWNIRQILVMPGQSKDMQLKVEVPMQVNKGNYKFKVIAEGMDELPIVINVSEQGTFKTEFTSDQANMQGNSKATFTFRTKLKNQTGQKQLYSLRSDAPRGWQVTFKPDYQQATSVEVEANITKEISIEIKPPEFIEAGTYKIPVSAITNETVANLQLEVVVTGSYEMQLTTPTGLLSASITAGDEKKLELTIRNSGSAELKDIKFSASKPLNWDVVFNPKEIGSLPAGSSTTVMATMKADKKAIAGDYAVTITASVPEVSSNAALRIAVKTPMIWGWVGILIIAGAVGSVYYLFRKYGRR